MLGSETAMGSYFLPTSPEDITHRGVGLPAACVSGDLPLAALLLAEGTESGIDMLAPDLVGGGNAACELLGAGDEDPLDRHFSSFFFLNTGLPSKKLAVLEAQNPSVDRAAVF